MTNEIELRPAVPTDGDGRAFARYLDIAAEGFFRFLLGPRSADILARAFVERGHDLSYENVTFAVRDAVIIGMVSGFAADYRDRSSSRPLVQAAGRFNLRFLVLSAALAPVFRVLDTMGPGEFYVLAIAVDKTVRGEGLGSTLLRAIEEQARAAGATGLALDVAASNDGARKVYEHRGWTVTARWPRRFDLPGLTLLRMTKPLPAAGGRGAPS